MADEKRGEVIRIELTAAQREHLKAKTGRDVESVELTVRELEERIAPRLGGNHNEAMLVEPN